ncbi:MAG TPA: magnesium chelatase ATPase subunit D [Blastocatellia bacterium]
MQPAKRALTLLAVDGGLRGALIESGACADATALARSFAAMLARVESSSSNPEAHSPSVKRAFPLIDLPLNVTMDRLLGGIDLQRTVETGARHYTTGLLAEANDGLLLAAGINLLDSSLTDQIAAALEAGFVRVEREGMSATLHSLFRLIGTYNAEEGEVSAHLKDRAGLLIAGTPEDSAEDIAEAVSRAIRFERDPDGFAEEFALETALLQSVVADARARLGEVRVAVRDIRRIAEAAIRLGVEGNRADIFAVKAARANAALDGRERVSDEDIITAIHFVLLPRATRCPAPEERKEETDEVADEGDVNEAGDGDTRARANDSSGGDFIEGSDRTIEELIIEAMDSPAPADALKLPRGKPGRGGSGRRAQVLDYARGRYVGSISKRDKNMRLAIDATLRAAAPHQVARRYRKIASLSYGAGDKKVCLTSDDLRFKKFKRKAGILFIFAVDASGSMALNRMAQAKGALARLLQQAYLHRDKVALISFRRSTAETILAPTRSVEVAKRIVDSLPTGGATPIAAALVEALSLARLARSQGLPRAMLLLLTDGRANAGLHVEGRKEASRRAESISEELQRIGRVLETENIEAVVIDTRPRFVSTGEGQALAELIRGRYLYLPRADTAAIYNAVAKVAEDARRRG